MAKPNYRHAKKQKEASRKARQDAKLQRRSHAPDTADAGAAFAGAAFAGAAFAGAAPAADAPAAPVPAKPLGT